MKKTKIKNRIISVSAALLLVLFTFSSCGTVGSELHITSDVVAQNIITPDAEENENLHYSDGKNSFKENVASSGLIKLLLDSEKCSFGIYNTADNTLWSALPLLENLYDNEPRTSTASIVSIRVLGGTDIYELNSQDNSLAYGKARYDLISGGLCFYFDIFSDAATADKTAFAKTDIGFQVILSVTLVDGNMKVSCKWKNLTGNKDAFIEKLSVLNYFGAYNDTAHGNYIFVPDGSGAIINTSIYDEAFESLTFSVYGSDAANPSETSGTALIPAFGIKHGDGACAVIIEEGDAAAEINAAKAMDLSSYNKAYASFNITPSKYENNTLYVAGNDGLKQVGLCYRFLSGKNATYAGMASSVREQLIRNHVLSSINVDDTDYLPFFLSLNGLIKKSASGLKYQSVLTDFDQAKDMLVRMKSKGINNVNLRYSNIFKGGQDTGDISSASFSLRMGTKSTLANLYAYMEAQKMDMYIDINLMTSVKKFKSNILSVSKELPTIQRESGLAGSAGTTPKPNYLRKLSGLKQAVLSVLSEANSNILTGLCLNDAGSILYSDYSSGGMLRQEAADTVAGAVLPLSSSRKIMVDTGNFFVLKNVSSVINIPLSAKVSKSGAYKPVPFVQIVLHGIVDYAGEPFNTAVNSKEMMLKSIEYGACPHYEWNYTPISGGEKDIYYYDNTINDAADFYARADAALNDLRDARITDHFEEEDGIFCTEYDTGSVIYVNYTDRDYEVLGVTVEKGDFIRIN